MSTGWRRSDHAAREHRRLYPTRWVRLDDGERHRATQLGLRRQHESIEGGLTDYLGAHEAKSDVVGTFGEFGAAKFLGFEEPTRASLGRYNAPDLGDNIAVRTRSKWYYEVLVRPHEHDEFAFLLVTWVPPYAVMRGWYPGADAKQLPLIDHGDKGRPAHFVPHELLLAPEHLQL